MKDVLDFVSGNFYIALCLIGIAMAALPWVPFKVAIGGVTVNAPRTLSSRLILSAIGAALVAAAVFLVQRQIAQPEVSEPTITQYFSYVTLEGTLADCGASKCRMSYYTSGIFETPPGTTARYVGRVKTGGAILKFHSDPLHDVLNPQQYPNNPTYLEFAIEPQKSTDTLLKVQAELVIENTITPEKGKVGFHLPYKTSNAVVMIDFRHLGFAINRQFTASIESRRSDGSSVTGYVDPMLRKFSDGAVVVLLANDVLPDSSLVLSWGN